MTSQFVKSHGLGNDYLVVDPTRLPFALTPAAIRLVCDRHRGVGSDGVLAVAPRGSADFGLRIFNPDGSEAEKSGNGVRIFAKYLREHGYTDRDRFVIGTPGGPVPVALERSGGRVSVVTAEMGRAAFGGPDAIDVGGARLAVIPVSLGNPHCVVVVRDLAATDVLALGPLIERHPAFPHGTNVQFAQVVSPDEVRVRVWERGAGPTLASGSSACAVVAACHRAGLVGRDVTVIMPGGALRITVHGEGELRMTGPVEEVCAGDFSADLVRRIAESM